MAKNVQIPKVKTSPNTILVAVDLTPSSREVLKHALSVAGDGSRLILLHVIAAFENKGEEHTQTIATARQQLEQFCASDGLTEPELISFEVRSGPPFREILACAKKNAVGMIVLGVDKTSPLDGVALGHTADRVSRYATCPVLLVRESDADCKPQ